MQSTFHGLETARRAMMTQQYALHTVGHNISNANTEGYTRQRVNFSQTEPYPSIGKNAPRLPGHLGTGVKAGSIQRVREEFLDIQYRNEANKVGYWDARFNALQKMEDILNEPSEQGLNNQIDLFWSSLQDLTVDPEDSGARSVVRERGRFVAETFNYLHDSLSEIKNDYKNEIEVTQKEVNALLNQLDNVNEQIRKTEPHGYVTNDLYDEQDRLIDQLSRIVNIKVEREQSGGQPNSAAEGAATVYLVDDAGNPLMKDDGAGNLTPLKLVDGTGADKHMKMSIGFDTTDNFNFVDTFSFTDNSGSVAYTIDLDQMPRGEMKALVDAYGYGYRDTNGIAIVQGTYPDMIAELNVMAENFAKEINNIHQLGFTLADNNGNVKNGGLFFDLGSGDAAKSIKIHDNIIASRDNIAVASVNVDSLNDSGAFTLGGVNYGSPREAYEKWITTSPKTATAYANLQDLLRGTLKDDGGVTVDSFNALPQAFAGDGSNAKRLADMKGIIMDFNGSSGTIGSYYQSVIGDMAVDTQEATRMLASSSSLKDSVDFRRQSVSNVSLDEEMTLMIQFQHAYNAAARNITMVDEMLDRIINNMGVVGR
ncbi:flagellar hook-associated protein FlgK [Halalkalibacter nanhaiisediminis]|uniref:Flagellar hook-associated protein 1 n=1 Tax=Halalkalibacter nanhaiisediminis TaxID=688079 RepID=A0A562QUY6_9BACI|nr:flagellar hook-associated protein FlgK [Halalkalibacter nanhaiisediminis]TWI59946.1 flagellar hook-associated protein 1 FlgK [Halalkalibacter nanhaiisediminis]